MAKFKSTKLPIGEAKRLLSANDLLGAELLCQQIILDFPLNPDANRLLSKIQLGSMQLENAWNSLQRYLSVVKASRHDFDFCYELLDGCLLARQFEIMKRISHVLTQTFPSNGVFWNYLAIAFFESKQFDDAEAAGKKAVSLQPSNPGFLLSLGGILNSQEKFAEALNYLEQVIELEPFSIMGNNNLGNAYSALGRTQDAINCFLRALKYGAGHGLIHNNLAIAYSSLRQQQEAINSFERAIEIEPDLVSAYPSLINLYSDTGRVKDAINLSVATLAKWKSNSRIWSAYGNAQQKANQLDGAIESYMQALSFEEDPQSDLSRKIYSSLLFALNNHPTLPADVIYGGYQEFNQKFGLPFHSTWTPFSNTKDPDKKLRIAYISHSFYNHVCKYFLLPLMQGHDRTRFEIVAYADPPMEDDDTKKYRICVDEWVDIKGMSDEAVAKRIKQDGIDILVDIDGHTTNNRLGVMARKPAPVSLHWLDFGYTTGLTAVDYYLTDKYITNAGCDHLFSEKLWCLEHTSVMYRPNGQIPPLNDSPFLKDGIITFGTLSRSNRITHKVIRVWSAILDAMPNSRLVINSSDFSDHRIQEEVAQRFMEHGIERSRIDIGYSTPSWIPLEKIDIGLDCFPHNSGTTLIETLFMGIPFVTLADRPPVGRIGSSIAGAAGHPEWIAYSEMEYAEKVLSLAYDTNLLQHLRKNMRADLMKSPLMDEALFARDVENAYRQMWRIYCAKETL
ncbi:tetratricopeptide repeat protein [Undibacterium sp. SXout20W]|uniref:tetratricopeptide repeat protein n=1 Tax=Undibacterium sp. SXout20W TaxID=3413051 RepID=UPI003BEF7B72